MKGRNIPYSAAELAWLEANRLMIISAYHRAFCETFHRADVSRINLNSLRKRKGWKTGRTGCFEKGVAPHNKGKPCPPGKGGNHPNARKTQFRKGNLTGTAAARLKPIGTERLSKDGYLERKIHDGMPLQSRWRAVHLIRWEEINGPMPAGMALKCLNGNKLDTVPSNWEAISRGVLPRLNGGRATRVMAYDSAPDELKPVLMTMARVEQQASELRHKRRKAAA